MIICCWIISEINECAENNGRGQCQYACTNPCGSIGYNQLMYIRWTTEWIVCRMRIGIHFITVAYRYMQTTFVLESVK